MTPQDSKTETPVTPSRRDFIKTTAATVAGAAFTRAIEARSYAGEENTVKVALVGCGGRGTGAASQALSTKGPTKLVAMADVFENQINSSYQNLARGHEKQMDVPADRRFIGFDGYKKAIDCLGKGDVVLLTTPPAFRPMHVEYAVSKGVNVFMEKSFSVDTPGYWRIIKAGEEAAKKNVKIAGGLMSRHNKAEEAVISKIHDGAIGDVITIWAYRVHGPAKFSERQPGESELAFQIRNYSCFTWLNGTFHLDWLIHQLDIACWVKNEWPESVQGMGGRQVRSYADQMYDHFGAEYTFADGTRLHSMGRHMNKVWSQYGIFVHGSKGSAWVSEGNPKAYIYKNWKQTAENRIWEFNEPCPNCYQVEHDMLFDAIRNDKPYNESERCAKTTMVGIMGRMAIESGQQVKWDEALGSKRELAGNLEELKMDGKAPVSPDEKGAYPVAMPGETPGV